MQHIQDILDCQCNGKPVKGHTSSQGPALRSLACTVTLSPARTKPRPERPIGNLPRYRGHGAAAIRRALEALYLELRELAKQTGLKIEYRLTARTGERPNRAWREPTDVERSGAMPSSV